jgi:hydroxyethylthiazole kinase-like uncharacterized protein yjeF
MPEEEFLKILNRPADSHKYNYGHTLVIGGSPGMVGAPLLAAKAALRSGAGLVSIAGHGSVVGKLDARVEEIMTYRLSQDANQAADELTDFINSRKVTSVVFGPGFKPDKQEPILKALLNKSGDISLLIDGGGLVLLSQHTDYLDDISHGIQVTLTPHLGEFQRFFQEDLSKDKDELKIKAMEFTNIHNVNLVLKGHPTLVFYKGELRFTNSTGGPAMATAGSGDVLSGIIGGLFGQLNDTTAACNAGVYLHGLAADIAASEYTEPAVIASDLIENIATAYKQIKSKLSLN